MTNVESKTEVLNFIKPKLYFEPCEDNKFQSKNQGLKHPNTLITNLLASEDGVIKTNDKWITPEIITLCARPGKTTHVDKKITGNGFTTALLQKAPEEGKINIILVPHKSVIIGKRDAYYRGEFRSDIKAKFFFQEGTDTNFDGANVLMFVAESFILRKAEIEKIADKVNILALDEYHAFEQQAPHRRKLREFLPFVEETLNGSNASIITVTATPNLFSKIDISIQQNNIKPLQINVSKDRPGTIGRIKVDLKRGCNVIVCTNSAGALSTLKSRKGILEANFIIGDSLKGNLAKRCELRQNDNSKLNILSSRGFEGFDLKLKDARVYFLEDRAYEHETFYISNLYQALSRNRDSAVSNTIYYELNRIELKSKRKGSKWFKAATINQDIERFVNSSKISNDQKQAQKYKDLHPFVIFYQDDSSDGKWNVVKDQNAINLFRERELYDRHDWDSSSFKGFLKARNIGIRYLSDSVSRMSTKVKRDDKIKYLKRNSEYLYNNKIYGNDHKLKVVDLGEHQIKNNLIATADKYRKHLDNYLIEKGYYGSRELTDREETALRLLGDIKALTKLSNKVHKAFNARCHVKYSRRSGKLKKDAFIDQKNNTVCQLILAFAAHRFTVPKRYTSHRDYNLTVKVGVEEIAIVAKEFGSNVLEVDVRSCYPRLLYSICGIAFPDDFYGKDKKNKLAINILLNDFMFNASKKTPEKMQRYEALKAFDKFGFAPVVIEYLMVKYFHCDHRGSLFNFLAYHEKMLINQVSRELKDKSSYNDGIVRRHDSLLIIGNQSEDLNWINEVNYLGFGGFFDIDPKKVVDPEKFNRQLEVKKGQLSGHFTETLPLNLPRKPMIAKVSAVASVYKYNRNNHNIVTHGFKTPKPLSRRPIHQLPERIIDPNNEAFYKDIFQ
jgi:hypothetical protein